MNSQIVNLFTLKPAKGGQPFNSQAYTYTYMPES